LLEDGNDMKSKKKETQVNDDFKFVFSKSHLQKKDGCNDRRVANEREYVHEYSKDWRIKSCLHVMYEVGTHHVQRLDEDSIKREDNNKE
jgi:hypothetical protein